MNYRLTGNDRLIALRMVAIYAFFSGIWIYTSDHVLGFLIRDPEAIVRYSVFKGLAFIAVTVALLYHLIASYIRQNRQAEEALNSLNEELELRVAERTKELEWQNRELQATYQGLERETARRIQAVEELRAKEQMLLQQTRMTAMGDMLTNVAHHWRQPLNVIGLKVQQVGLTYQLGGFSGEFLQANIAETMTILRQLSQTIDDFLAVTTPDREKSSFPVAHVFANVLSLTRESFNEAGIAVEGECGNDLKIVGYPNEFTHVLMALVMNARDVFSEKGAADARIVMRSWPQDGRAVVTVTDNAGGINDEIMDRIFDPYFTTKEFGKGSGIGLFMAKNVIEKKMGGRLTVRNVDGGAEFRIEV